MKSDLTGEELEASVIVESLFPKTLRLGQTSDTKFLELEPKEVKGKLQDAFFDINLKLHRTKDG